MGVTEAGGQLQRPEPELVQPGDLTGVLTDLLGVDAVLSPHLFDHLPDLPEVRRLSRGDRQVQRQMPRRRRRGLGCQRGGNRVVVQGHMPYQRTPNSVRGNRRQPAAFSLVIALETSSRWEGRLSIEEAGPRSPGALFGGSPPVVST